MIYLKGPGTKQIGAKNVQLRGDAPPYPFYSISTDAA